MAVLTRLALLGTSLSLLVACAPPPEIRPVLLKGATNDAAQADDDYAAGKRHLAANELGLAVERFRKAVARDRGDVPALNALAACYDRLGRFDLADRYYDQALASAPADTQTLNNMGISRLMRGQPSRAVPLLQQALRKGPADPVIAANLARASAEAAETARELAEYDPAAERPNRLSRIGHNAWTLHTRALAQPAVWIQPLASRGEEPPPVLPAPRPVVTRLDIDAPAKPKVESARALDLQIVNGVGRRGMAARMRTWLSARGHAPASIGDAARFNTPATVLFYHPSRKGEAETLARLLPANVQLEARSARDHDLVLLLGRDLISFDRSHLSGGKR